MARITVITFLGTSFRQEPTEYANGGDRAKGFVFAQALQKFFEFDRMLVCMTDDAEEKVWKKLRSEGKARELMEDDRVQALPIKTGNDTGEMWDIFMTIAGEIEVEETVIFDITHGLRSLPFLVFLFAAYLKSAKRVKIQGIYYGALELSKANVTPVIDLSEFVEMLDWLGASERFIEMGDGSALAGLLKSRVERSGEALNQVAASIEAISLALVLARPLEAIEASGQLRKQLTEATQAIEARAKPFALLQEQVANAYGQFATDPIPPIVRFAKKIELTLDQQLLMIDWYREKGQIIQASGLAREWVISVLWVYFKENDRSDVKKIRLCIEKGLAGYTIDPKNDWVPLIQELENERKITDFWRRLTSLRNDLAHSGMHPKPESAEEVQGIMDGLYAELKLLIQPLLCEK